MAFMGADTDALREAGEECQEGKEKTDQVVQYLRALIMALRAAAFFTGGASAAYADYLEGTVVPWLERISQALGLMAKVLMQNAQEQDDVSDSGSQAAGAPRAAIAYSTPGGSMPTRPIGVWEGSLVPDATPGTTSDAGSSLASLGNLASTSTDGFGPEASPTLGSGSWATSDHVGQLTPTMAPPSAGASLSGASLSGTAPSGASLSGTSLSESAISGSVGGSWEGGSSLGGGALDDLFSPGGRNGVDASTSAGGGAGIGGGPGIGGGSGSGGVGSPSIGGAGPIGGSLESLDSPDGQSTDPGTGLSSYTSGNTLDGIGGATPDSGAHGDAGLGAATGAGEASSADAKPYAAAAGIAGGAAALGLGGAALAGRSGASADKRLDELASQNGRSSRGEGVSELQRRLTDAGYDTKGTDGAWGRNTQAAYDAYRKDHPLPIQHGAGYSAPSGFDYSKITGVKGNPNVTPAFLRGVEGVAQRIGAKPEHLMAVMSFETGGKFGADTPTKAQGGTAVGLIQFTTIAREQVGVSREQLMAMTPVQQLAYVEKYFEPRRGPQLGSIAGLYSAVLGGTASTDMDRVQIARGDAGWAGNKGLDSDGDGRITVREGASRIERALGGR